MSEAFIGEIRMFAGNFAPQGWAFCDGALLPIAQNTALFSLLGTFYGGNGQTNFALPNLQGRAPLQAGQGPGLSPRQLGATGGSETKGPIAVVVESAEHAHAIPAGGQAVTDGPVPSAEAALTRGVVLTGALAPGATSTNLQPYLALNFIIALVGIYPPRS